jgi:hypothetical protein
MTLDDLKPIYKEYDFKDYYYIDNKGQIYKVLLDGDKIDSIKKMSPFTTKDKYIEYVLTLRNGKKKHIQAHRITALTWLKKPKNYKTLEVNHKNGKRNDNRIKNLKFVTKSQNIRHSFDVLGKKVWNKGRKIKK